MAEGSRRRATSDRPLVSLFRYAFGLGVGALLALAILGPTCGSVPTAEPPVEPDAVRTIEDFVSCLNGLSGRQNASIADTVECLPPKCMITLTMSRLSAQKACVIGDCQLPRVLLDCPGPPRFRPSYLLCPTGSVAGGHLGIDRVEVGEAVDAAGNMRMADIPIPPGAFPQLDAEGVLSTTNHDKGCNEGSTCHTAQEQSDLSDEILSRPLEAFLRPQCIIDTEDCEKNAITTPQGCGLLQARPQSLAELCDCIGFAIDDLGDNAIKALPNAAIMRNLCNALETYQNTRGACTMADCPSASGPLCFDAGAPCDPSTGDTVEVDARYHCVATESDEFQCVADCPCRTYDLLGGGKYLVNGAVSMVRVELDGLVATPDPGEFADDDAIMGTVSAFNYLTHTLIESVSFTSLEATQIGADFSATGAGTALVNGVTTNIEFDATQTGSDASFELRNADTSAVLAGGIGEDDRSAFQLSVGP